MIWNKENAIFYGVDWSVLIGRVGAHFNDHFFFLCVHDCFETINYIFYWRGSPRLLCLAPTKHTGLRLGHGNNRCFFFFLPSNLFTECQFGKSLRELGSTWYADLGPPFGIMYCIKCECVPVSDLHQTHLCLQFHFRKWIYPHFGLSNERNNTYRENRHRKTSTRSVNRGNDGGGGNRVLITTATEGANAVLRAVRDFALAFTWKCGWRTRRTHNWNIAKTCECSAQNLNTPLSWTMPPPPPPSHSPHERNFYCTFARI